MRWWLLLLFTVVPAAELFLLAFTLTSFGVMMAARIKQVPVFMALSALPASSRAAR